LNNNVDRCHLDQNINSLLIYAFQEKEIGWPFLIHWSSEYAEALQTRPKSEPGTGKGKDTPIVD
jgi:hypothetical protein